jgi:hypothetical protein
MTNMDPLQRAMTTITTCTRFPSTVAAQSLLPPSHQKTPYVARRSQVIEAIVIPQPW